MGSYSLTAMVVAASLMASVILDIGVNVVQDWYETFYSDAFWSNRPLNREIDQQLRKEEEEIDRLMREDNFVSEEGEAR